MKMQICVHADRRETVKKRNHIVGTYLIAVAVVFLYIAFGKGQTGTSLGFDSGKVTELSDGWSYSEDGGASEQISLPQNRSIPGVQRVTISRKLPEQIDDGSSLAVYSSFQYIQVYVGQNKVRAYNGAAGILRTDVPVTQILLISADESWAGQKLTISYESPLSSRKGVLHPVLLGDRMDIIYSLLAHRLLIILSGALLIVIGTVIVGYRAFSGTKGLIGQALQYQGLYMLMLGVFFVLQAGMNQILFCDLNWSRFLEFFSIMLVPVTSILEVDTVEKHRFGRLSDILCGSCILMILLECTMAIVFHIDYMKVIVLTYLMLAMSVVYVVGTVWYIAVTDGQLMREMKWMIYAYMSMAAAGIGEILLYYVDSDKEDCRILAAGVLLHALFSMQWIIQQRNLQENAKERSLQQAEAKSVFLANMSHEIRTPISAVLGINEMILRKTDDAEILGYAKDIRESGNNLLTLINNILNYSGIESGKLELLNADYDLMNLLQELYAHTKQSIRAQNVILKIETDPNLPAVLTGDRNKVRIILWNILQNAVHYTKKGFIRMYVTGSRRGSHVELIFRIEDTGEGMSENVQKKIFESFSRSESHVAEGIGLGLTVAGYFAKAMNGTVSVHSLEGKGSQFVVRIIQEYAVSGLLGTFYENADPANKQWTAPEAGLLIVDDEPINLKIIQGFLSHSEIKTELAADGYEALQKASGKQYDVILLDHMMPGMDGEETFAALQRIAQRRKIATPVVMLSAGAQDEQKYYISKGFSGYLQKPVNQDQLLEILFRLIPQDKIKPKI